MEKEAIVVCPTVRGATVCQIQAWLRDKLQKELELQVRCHLKNYKRLKQRKSWPKQEHKFRAVAICRETCLYEQEIAKSYVYRRKDV